MGRPYKRIKIETDLTDLWKPNTWGKTSIGYKDLCGDCFSKFLAFF